MRFGNPVVGTSEMDGVYDPAWLVVASWAALALAGLCASWILVDIAIRGRHQDMPIMNVVWPVTALYLGPVAVWGYLRFGQPKSQVWRSQHHMNHPPSQPMWASYAVGVSHCGAGCTLADIFAEWLIFAFGITIAGLALVPEFIGDYILAVSLGIVFQYFAIAPMRHLGLRDGLVQAAKADIVSLTAFEVGLFGWMAITQLLFFPGPHLHPDSPVYWFFMQIGMTIGFATAWPANVWLIKRGIKEAM